MAKAIIWSATASKDLKHILAFWIEKTGSKNYSSKLAQLFFAQLEQLSNYPFLGKPSEMENIRCLPLGHYSIFYQVTDERVIIHRIWDNRNNPADLKA